jgi:hypothetical protein
MALQVASKNGFSRIGLDLHLYYWKAKPRHDQQQDQYYHHHHQQQQHHLNSFHFYLDHLGEEMFDLRHERGTIETIQILPYWH